VGVRVASRLEKQSLGSMDGWHTGEAATSHCGEELPVRCIARVSRRAAAFLAAPAMFERWFDLYYTNRAILSTMYTPVPRCQPCLHYCPGGSTAPPPQALSVRCGCPNQIARMHRPSETLGVCVRVCSRGMHTVGEKRHTPAACSAAEPRCRHQRLAGSQAGVCARGVGSPRCCTTCPSGVARASTQPVQLVQSVHVWRDCGGPFRSAWLPRFRHAGETRVLVPGPTRVPPPLDLPPSAHVTGPVVGGSQRLVRVTRQKVGVTLLASEASDVDFFLRPKKHLNPRKVNLTPFA